MQAWELISGDEKLLTIAKKKVFGKCVKLKRFTSHRIVNSVLPSTAKVFLSFVFDRLMFTAIQLFPYLETVINGQLIHDRTIVVSIKVKYIGLCTW